MATIQLLTTAPIYEDTPEDQDTRQAMELLKTAMNQQAQYSQGYSHLHGTPYQSMSRQAESPGPAASSSHRQQRGPQNPDPRRPMVFIGQLAYPAPEHRVESAIQFPPPTK